MRVRFADDRKLEARRSDRVDEWPQVPDNAQFDPCLNMSGKQITHGPDDHGHHLALCHPITCVRNLWREGRGVEFVGIEPTSPDPLQPSGLYRMQPARTTQTKKGLTGFEDWFFSGPTASAWTIARKPVARCMLFVDGPD